MRVYILYRTPYTIINIFYIKLSIYKSFYIELSMYLDRFHGYRLPWPHVLAQQQKSNK